MCHFLRAAALTAALCFTTAGFARADDATLTARGGGLSVSGQLVGFDGSVFRIDTAWGRLTVDAAAVDCTGPGCPDLLRFAPEWRIAVEPWIADRVLRPLAQGFADAQGLTLTAPGPTTLEFADDTGVLLRLQVLPLSGAADPVLAAGAADAALAVPAPGPGASTLIARLPLVPASARDAPPGPLDLGALRSARQDRAPTWAALGAPERPLVWHGMPGGGALDRATVAALGPVRATPRQSGEPAQLGDALSRDPWGLALLPRPLPAGLAARTIRTTCGLEADLSDFAAATGDHPLLLALHWLPGTRRSPPIVRDFIAWAAAPSGQTMLASVGVPAPSASLRRPLAAQGGRLANALATARDSAALVALQAGVRSLAGAEQLAMSFRYDPQGGALDAESRSVLEGLSMHLAGGSFRGHELLLVGMTDPGEAPGKGLARAQDLATALAAIPDLSGDTTVTAIGLGATLPVACNDTPTGRRLNRRVEVWLRPIQ
jgi:phosphate transport system substrate-binding protein